MTMLYDIDDALCSYLFALNGRRVERMMVNGQVGKERVASVIRAEASNSAGGGAVPDRVSVGQ
jgi:hypothetical protein